MDIVSSRKFDNELKRITMLFNNEQLIQKYKGKHKYSIINFDYILDSSNLLSESYYAKAFKDIEFKLYFLIVQTLSSKEMSLRDIEETLNERLADIDRATLRNHLNKMVAEGYLLARNDGNKKMYALSKPVLDELSDEELKQLSNAIEFYKDTCNIKMPAYHLANTLAALCEEKHIPTKSHFVFKHGFRHQILDEEALISIQSAIENGQSISFVYNSGTTETFKNISPAKMVYDLFYGRTYLFGRSPVSDQVCIFRIDRMTDIQQTGRHTYSNIFEDLKYAWNVAGIGNQPEHIVIDFSFDENEERHLVARLKREARHGTVSRVSRGKYRFEIDVLDPIEMFPWLRTFYGHITDIDNTAFRSRVSEDITEIMERYETV